MEMVTKLTHKSLRALQGTGHRNLSRKNQKVLDVLALPLNVLNSDPDDCLNTSPRPLREATPIFRTMIPCWCVLGTDSSEVHSSDRLRPWSMVFMVFMFESRDPPLRPPFDFRAVC